MPRERLKPGHSGGNSHRAGQPDSDGWGLFPGPALAALGPAL